MKTKPIILQTLNRILRHELTLINQYFLHSRMVNNWGYEGIGKPMYKQSIQAMKNADALIARIFFLEGLPNLQDLGKLFIGENAAEALSCDLKAAHEQLAAQKEAIILLEKEEDFVSRQLVRAQLAETEEYIDWLEEQLGLIDHIGLANYLQSSVKKAL